MDASHPLSCYWRYANHSETDQKERSDEAEPITIREKRKYVEKNIDAAEGAKIRQLCIAAGCNDGSNDDIDDNDGSDDIS
jgi:hypothetical protein